MTDTITAFTPNREIIGNIQNNYSLQAREIVITNMYVETCCTGLIQIPK